MIAIGLGLGISFGAGGRSPPTGYAFVVAKNALGNYETVYAKNSLGNYQPVVARIA